MNRRCLICTGKMEPHESGEAHKKCNLGLFGADELPELDYRLTELSELAKKVVRQRVTVPGVQAKLSLEIERQSGQTPKLTIVGLWGGYILKPPSSRWPELPQNEHCTMQMAEAVGIETVPYGLIRVKSGELAFVSKRIDREKGRKLAMEDMCQLSGRLTEDKYKGSHEQVAKTIKKYTSNPLFDIVRFYELTLFCYLTGNGDMHLKNFSLINDMQTGWKLSPAYDLLSTRLVIPASTDPEELALTLAGKKSNFSRNNFIEFGSHIGLTVKQIQNVFEKLESNTARLTQIIDRSFLSDDMKQLYKEMLKERSDVLGLAL